MSDRRRFVALGAKTLFSALLLGGCGNFESDDKGTGGGGGSGQSGTSGTSGASGASGSAGASGTGTGGSQSGSGGMPTGGSSGVGGGGAGAGTGGMSGSGGQASCTNLAAPCGGDVVGAWTATSCLTVTGNVNMAAIGAGCVTAPITSATLQVSGTWTANATGMMVMDNTTTSGTQNFTLAPECLMISGTTSACDRMGGVLVGLGYYDVTCTDAAGGGCTCSAVIQQTGGLGFASTAPLTSGTYSTAENVLTTSDGIAETDYSYCVSGNTLTLSLQTMGNTGTVTGTIVLQK